MLSRRAFLGGAAALPLAPGCRARGAPGLRFGFMTNLTHAPAMAAAASGRLSEALGAPVEVRSFRAGPRVLEALLGDAIDVGVSGPAPIVYTHSRHPGLLRVVSGCSSGGASFVVARGAGIERPEDLRGKTVATTQIGTTQDISLRKFLRTHGYEPAERGGDVTVHALDATTILMEIRRGALDGAWLPEPWATRVVREAQAVRWIDERDLWPGRTFPTALVVARQDFARAQPARIAQLVTEIGAEVSRAKAAPAETRELARSELARLLGKTLPKPLVEDAWRYIDFTSDPMADKVETIAEDAFALGLAPRTSCRELFG